MCLWRFDGRVLKCCKRVVGTEHDFERASIAQARGLALRDEIPDADVYYVWVNSWGLTEAMEKLKSKHGILVLAEEARNPDLGGYEIAIPIPEECDKDRQFWHLQIVEI